MLDLIIGILEDHGLFDLKSQPRVAVQMTGGNNFLVSVYVGGKRFWHVRAAEDCDLSGEATIAMSVRESLGRFVPLPLVYERREGLDVIVFEGIDMVSPSPSELMRASGEGQIGRELEDFFRLTSDRQDQLTGGLSPQAEIAQLQRRFSGTDREKDLDRALSRVRGSPLWRLPGIAQHGDLVLNNLGVCDGRLIVYDWEDFGKSSVRGFDLAVLLASVCLFDPARLKDLRSRGRESSPAAKAGWLGPCCNAIGIELEQFWAAMPLYLLLFLRLKDPYSDHIKSLVTRAAVGLL